MVPGMAGFTAGPQEGTLGVLEKGWLGTHVHLCVRVCLCVCPCVCVCAYGPGLCGLHVECLSGV